MARVIVRGKILHDRLLQNVQSRKVDGEEIWEAVSIPGGEDVIVLESFDTALKAEEYIEGIGDKLIEGGLTDVIDAR